MNGSGCGRACRSRSTGMPIWRILPQMPLISGRPASMSMKTLSDLNACSKDDFVAALANIFEYSPWLAEQAASCGPPTAGKQLFEAMKAAGDRPVPELRLEANTAHPAVANKVQRAAGLTAESNAE